MGVISDELLYGLGSNHPVPGVYATNDQSPQASQALLVRTAMDPALVARLVRERDTQISGQGDDACRQELRHSVHLSAHCGRICMRRLIADPRRLAQGSKLSAYLPPAGR